MNDETRIGPDEPDITPIAIEDELKTSYLDYAMSVIVARALPDVRDGLKPVHRRILYSMHENGFDASKPYRKSARIVGDAMGKYHPHGDTSIYDALVRMAQPFSMRLMLVDGQGNFGSMDGDKAAAMRYTEARMSKAAAALLADIDKDTVDFRPNYDGSEHEPSVLPARLPNLLVNGAGGIAVGMATNIPPQNLGEVIDAALMLIDQPDATTLDLMEHVQGPDFPTGATILGTAGIRMAYETGRGSITIRAKTHIEERAKDRESIVVTEIPFQVNKASLVEKIADGVKNKKIEGISDLRDESDRDGVRVVVELKRDAIPDVVLNQLYRFTPLQTSFGINMLALTSSGQPQQMGLKEILDSFLTFRQEVVTRRSKFELMKARDRAHVLVGLVIAVTNIDEIVATIRGAQSPAEAREALLKRQWDTADVAEYLALIDDPLAEIKGTKVRLTDRQVKAILDLRLHRLTALGREEIGAELKKLGESIADYLDILSSRERLLTIIREELTEVRDQFADDRRTTIEESEFDEIEDEDLIRREDMVVTVTHSGYVKRVPLSTYRAQRRGGKGRAGMSTKEEDFLTAVFVASTHTPVLFFSSLGQVYKLKVWKLPLSTPQGKGKAIINLLKLEQGEMISTILPLPEDEDSWDDLNVMFATASGNVRRNSMADFTNVPSNGKIAIRFEEGSDDHLVGVSLCSPEDDVLLAARDGKAVRFPVDLVRVFKGRTSMGVRGMKLKKGDRVISMSILKGQEGTVEERSAYLKAAPWKSEAPKPELAKNRMAELAKAEEFILTVTEKGYGKRTSSHEFRTMGRGGQGVANIEVNERNGRVVASFPVVDDDQIIMVTDQGKIIRTRVHNVRIAGRGTQGVTLFKVAEDESVRSVAKLPEHEDEEDEGDNGVNGESGEESQDGENDA